MMRRITSVAMILIAALIFSINAKAEEQPTLLKMHSTAYCLDGITASGEPVRKGICASGHKDWIGKTVVLYQRLPSGEVGKILGIFEVKDTGCKDSVIDVWMPDLEECQKWMDKLYEDGCQGKVFCEVIEADG